MAKSSKNDVRFAFTSASGSSCVGSQERPRLAVFRSLKHIYAQVIDDAQGPHAGGGVLGRKEGERGARAAIWPAPKQIGKLIAERAKDKGISKVVFDRGGYLYHGRVKALADAAREAGLEF